MTRTLRIALLAFAVATMAMLGCKDDKGGEGQAKAGEAKKAAEGPKMDCDAFTKKMLECGDQFKAEYAKTKQAKTAGQGDGAKGAKYFMMGFRDQNAVDTIGMKICKEQYAIRDPRWQTRYAKCDLKADCATWAACAAPAMGNPLSVPK